VTVCELVSADSVADWSPQEARVRQNLINRGGVMKLVIEKVVWYRNDMVLFLSVVEFYRWS
jgi:hypothetical protein